MIIDMAPPEPGSAHPAYSPEDVATVRYWLEELPEPHLVMPAVGSAAYVCSCDTANEIMGTPRTRVFAAAEAYAEAPWAERRFRYRWLVGIDDLGRMIATDPEPWYEPEWVTTRHKLGLYR